LWPECIPTRSLSRTAAFTERPSHVRSPRYCPNRYSDLAPDETCAAGRESKVEGGSRNASQLDLFVVWMQSPKDHVPHYSRAQVSRPTCRRRFMQSYVCGVPGLRKRI